MVSPPHRSRGRPPLLRAAVPTRSRVLLADLRAVGRNAERGDPAGRLLLGSLTPAHPRARRARHSRLSDHALSSRRPRPALSRRGVSARRAIDRGSLVRLLLYGSEWRLAEFAGPAGGYAAALRPAPRRRRVWVPAERLLRF